MQSPPLAPQHHCIIFLLCCFQLCCLFSNSCHCIGPVSSAVLFPSVIPLCSLIFQLDITMFSVFIPQRHVPCTAKLSKLMCQISCASVHEAHVQAWTCLMSVGWIWSTLSCYELYMHCRADLYINRRHSNRTHVTQLSFSGSWVAAVFKILPAQSFQAASPSPHTEPYPGNTPPPILSLDWAGSPFTAWNQIPMHQHKSSKTKIAQLEKRWRYITNTSEEHMKFYIYWFMAFLLSFFHYFFQMWVSIPLKTVHESLGYYSIKRWANKIL